MKNYLNFEKDIKDQLGEALRRGRHFQSMFQGDMERNSDIGKDLMVLPGDLGDNLLANVDTEFGGTDKFDRGGTGKEGSGGFISETAGENDGLGGQQA